ncbi:sulfurtransferase complex subunit TusC [Pleionea sediminis]|uniref:sulfurtransferase complex subunit TusC n=1 Tax=Pleionea sediminis TaxID=2569479 RepID=UPI0011867CDA|nr:sulfurtransferase complex subunit TusC [Pleionea sediminis]
MNQLYIFTKPPYSTDSGKEQLDMALAAASFDQSVGLLFVGEGVWQLIDDQHPKLVGQKEYTRLFNGLDLYDIEHLYVYHKSLTHYGLLPEQLLRKVEILNDAEYKNLIERSSQVFSL